MRDNSQAVSTFIARKAEFDAILAELSALSANHFNADPDALHWGDVGSISGALAALREVAERGGYAA